MTLLSRTNHNQPTTDIIITPEVKAVFFDYIEGGNFSASPIFGSLGSFLYQLGIMDPLARTSIEEAVVRSQQ